MIYRKTAWRQDAAPTKIGFSQGRHPAAKRYRDVLMF